MSSAELELVLHRTQAELFNQVAVGLGRYMMHLPKVTGAVQNV